MRELDVNWQTICNPCGRLVTTAADSADCFPRPPNARHETPRPVLRYRCAPNENLAHLDIKSLKRIVRVGHCLHGDRTQRARGAGWDYLHVAIDDHSRLLNAEVPGVDGGLTTASFSGAGGRVA